MKVGMIPASHLSAPLSIKEVNQPTSPFPPFELLDGAKFFCSSLHLLFIVVHQFNHNITFLPSTLIRQISMSTSSEQPEKPLHEYVSHWLQDSNSLIKPSQTPHHLTRKRLRWPRKHLLDDTRKAPMLPLLLLPQHLLQQGEPRK